MIADGLAAAICAGAEPFRVCVKALPRRFADRGVWPSAAEKTSVGPRTVILEILEEDLCKRELLQILVLSGVVADLGECIARRDRR